MPGVGVGVGPKLTGVGVGEGEVALTLPHPATKAVIHKPKTKRPKVETKFFIFFCALHQGKVGCCWIRKQSRAAGWPCSVKIHSCVRDFFLKPRSAAKGRYFSFKLDKLILEGENKKGLITQAFWVRSGDKDPLLRLVISEKALRKRSCHLIASLQSPLFPDRCPADRTAASSWPHWLSQK